MRRKPHGITRAFLCVIRYTMILPKILKNFAELLRAVTHHHHHHRTWTWRLSACTRQRGIPHCHLPRRRSRRLHPLASAAVAASAAAASTAAAFLATASLAAASIAAASALAAATIAMITKLTGAAATGHPPLTASCFPPPATAAAARRRPQ